MNDLISELERHLLPDGCRCSEETNAERCCGVAGNPPKCQHMVASEYLNEIGEIVREAIRQVKNSPSYKRES